MNILSIEEKFKALDDKEKKVRQYFNPKTTKGKKHHYISDIRADFQYDTLLYGLGMFWAQDSDSEVAEEPKKEISAAIVSRPGPSKTKSPLLAKRKNLGLLDLQKPLTKDHYEGIFSDTKVLNHDYLYKKPNIDFGVSGWKTAAIGERNLINKAAKVEIIYSSKIKDCTDELNQKIKKYKFESSRKPDFQRSDFMNKDEFKSYLEEFKTRVLSNKDPETFKLSLESLRREIPKPKDSLEKPKLFNIIFQNSLFFTIKSLNKVLSLTLTDISLPNYPSHHYSDLETHNSTVFINADQIKNNTGVDLSQIFQENIEKHTIRVLIQGELETLDYYISLQEHKQVTEELVMKEIIDYKLHIYDTLKSQLNKGIVVPLKLQNLGTQSKRIKLPLLDSKVKVVETKKRAYENPITSALFTYKTTTELFHPQAYPANLSIFEAHDFIEENYALPPKPKPILEKISVQLGIYGQGLNNSYMS